MTYHQHKEQVMQFKPNNRQHLLLKCHENGTPLAWITWREGLNYALKNKIAWQRGATAHGSQINTQNTDVQLHNIIGIHIPANIGSQPKAIRLTNQTLFLRDRYMCLYCGVHYHQQVLSRDHIIPRSRGGADHWTNCATACIPCNQAKSNHTPDEAHMPLLALPYEPSPIEGLILKNRRILADQMDFLLTHKHKEVDSDPHENSNPLASPDNSFSA